MMPNITCHRVQIQVKTSTRTATGETVTWKPVESRWGRVIPVDVRTRLAYQQLNSEVTHKLLFNGIVSINFNNRFIWQDKTLQPVEPAQIIGDSTQIICKEI